MENLFWKNCQSGPAGAKKGQFGPERVKTARNGEKGSKRVKIGQNEGFWAKFLIKIFLVKKKVKKSEKMVQKKPSQAYLLRHKKGQFWLKKS